MGSSGRDTKWLVWGIFWRQNSFNWTASENSPRMWILREPRKVPHKRASSHLMTGLDQVRPGSISPLPSPTHLLPWVWSKIAAFISKWGRRDMMHTGGKNKPTRSSFCPMMTAWPELMKEEFIQLLHGPGHNKGMITVNWEEPESYYDLP